MDKTCLNLWRIRAALILLAVPGGCNSMTQSAARQQARRQWGTVRAEIKLQLARQAFEHLHFDEAAEAASEAVSADATLVDGYVLLAQAYIASGNTLDAEQVIATARAAKLASGELDYTEGVLRELRSRPEEALAWYARARRFDPTNVEFLIAQVDCLLALDRTDTAMRLLNDTRSAFVDSVALALLGARTAELLGRPAEAARWYQAAYAIDPGAADIARPFGRLLVRLGRVEEAILVLEPLLADTASTGGEGEIRRALAAAHLALGRAKAAFRVIAPYAEDHDEDTSAQLLLAQAATALRRIHVANKAVALAIRNAPHASQPRLLLALLQNDSGNHGAAAATLFDLLAGHPNNVEAHCLLGEVMIDVKRLDAARIHFKRAAELRPNSPWATGGLRRLPPSAPDHTEHPVKISSTRST